MPNGRYGDTTVPELVKDNVGGAAHAKNGNSPYLGVFGLGGL